MTQPGKVAEAEVCESGVCDVGNLLVRGNKISFLSLSEAKRSGAKRKEVDGRVVWTPRAPVSDVRIPRDYVLIHDTTGSLLSRCDLYVLRWYPVRKGNELLMSPVEREAASRYYGSKTPIHYGSVDIVKGPWVRIGLVQFIRYFRAGQQQDEYEHEFDPPTVLFYCKRPLAWRLPLPDGCVVDDRGFVWP